MKIITKLPDYYDHEIAYFGYDPTRVYDRRNDPKIFSIAPNQSKEWLWSINICIAGKVFPVIKRNGRFFHREDANLFAPGSIDRDFLSPFKKDAFTDLNEKLRLPVFATSYDLHRDLRKRDVFIPILAQCGIPTVLDSRTCYQMIYDFIGYLKDHPEIPDKMTDKEKVKSHGFDVKTSFRPKIKSKE